MTAQSQDQWWRPLTKIGLKEPRWVRAVEMRPGTTAGRKITHHALAHLVQDDPDARDSATRSATAAAARMKPAR